MVDAREGSFGRSPCEEVLKFCPLAENRGSLEGVRERGFKSSEFRVNVLGFRVWGLELEILGFELRVQFRTCNLRFRV